MRGAFGSEPLAQFAIGGHASGDQDASGAKLFPRGKGLLQQIANHGMLKAGDEVERRLRAKRESCLASLRRAEIGDHARRTGCGFLAHAVQFNVAQHRRLDAGKRKEEARIELGNGCGFRGLGARSFSGEVRFGFDPRKRKRHRLRIAESGERIDPRAAGIAQSEQLGHLVIGFAGCVVDGAAYKTVTPGAVRRPRQVEMRVAAGNNQRQCRLCLEIFRAALFFAFAKQDGVDVPLEMVHGDERNPLRKRQCFGVGDAHQQRSCQTGPGSDSNGVETVEGNPGASEGFAHDGHNGAQVFAAGELGNHSPVRRVSSDLRGHGRRKRARAALHHRGCSFVAGGFHAEDEAAAHVFSLSGWRAQVPPRGGGGIWVKMKAGMPATPQFEEAKRIAGALREKGFEAYLAGGCVRDMVLGREPADYDVATNATPDVVLSIFERTFAVGAHFGVVLVAPSDENERFVTEVATFRSDAAYSDGRHPDAVRYTSRAEEDVQRRDFTINGLLLDPLRDIVNPRAAVIDYVGGLADLDACIVRAIGRPELRFEEDRLRMLRAVRFAARFDFEPEPATFAAIRALAARIHAVSRERIRDELTKMLTEGRARRAFELLDATGLLAQVLPEIERMKGVEQPPQFHPEGDVWIHTLMVLEQLQPGSSATLAWGALLHDVGKPATFRRAPDRIRFDGHVEVGMAIATEICRRMRFSNDEAHQIVALVEHHMRFADAPQMKSSTLKRFFRLPAFDEHLALHRMDCMAAHRRLENYDYVRERWQSTPEAEVRPPRLLTGRELIAAGYQPGERFREMLQAVEDAQLDGAIASPEQAMELVRTRFPLN
jgi:poly(A) polymerase